MNIKEMSIADLKPYENNPRKNDSAVEAVAKSIEQFGFKVPLVIDSENVIVAGHTRYKAAEKLGLEKVPCIVADDLSPEQIKAFRLADNKVSELATWNFEKLTEELSALDEINFDMSDFGFNDTPPINWDDVPDLTEESYKVIGLSKVARIADMVCRRLQLQEKICSDILEIMKKIVGENVIVYAEGEHSCLTARGIKKVGTVTKTLACSGGFENELFRQKFFDLVGV